MKTQILILAGSGLPCWLWWLLAMLFSFILGWLLSKLFRGSANANISGDGNIQGFTGNANISGELEAANAKISRLEADLHTAKSATPAERIVEKIVEVDKIVEVEKIVERIVEVEKKSDIQPIVAAVTTPRDFTLAAEILGGKVKQDDLKLVEGIGPKIEELFHNAGIKTWAELAATAPEKLKAILDEAGPAYKMHNPATWPSQCQLMVDDKWKELKELQDQLNAGKE